MAVTVAAIRTEGIGRGPRQIGPGRSRFGRGAVTFVVIRRLKSQTTSFRGAVRTSGRKIADGIGLRGRVPSTRRSSRTGKISSKVRGADVRVGSQRAVAEGVVESRRAGLRTTGVGAQGRRAG